MREIEFKEYKTNNWFYEPFKRNSYLRNESNNCSQHYDRKFLDRNCRKNCYTSSFILNIDSQSVGISTAYNIIRGSDFYKTKLLYLPKMDFITYLGSIGGLNSMWTGLSVYSFIESLNEIISKTMRKFYETFEYDLYETSLSIIENSKESKLFTEDS
jgi:hypothetical protein